MSKKHRQHVEQCALSSGRGASSSASLQHQGPQRRERLAEIDAGASYVLALRDFDITDSGRLRRLQVQFHPGRRSGSEHSSRNVSFLTTASIHRRRSNLIIIIYIIKKEKSLWNRPPVLTAAVLIHIRCSELTGRCFFFFCRVVNMCASILRDNGVEYACWARRERLPQRPPAGRSDLRGL